MAGNPPQRANTDPSPTSPTDPVEIERIEDSAPTDPLDEVVEPEPSPPAVADLLETTWTADRGGFNRCGAIRSVIPESTPRERLRLDLSGEVRSSPLVAGNVLQFATRNGRFISIDLATGQRQWSGGTHAVRGSAPTMSQETTFVAEVARGGRLHAFDRSNGNRRWTHNVGPTTSSLVLDGELLFVLNNDLGGIGALSSSNGEEQWRVEIEGWHGHPAMSESRLIIATESGLVALATNDGRELWRTTLASPPTSPAILDDTIVAALENGSIAALAVEDGRVLGTSEELGAPMGVPAFDGQRIAVVGNETLFVLDADSREVIWQAPAARGTAPVITSNAVLVLTAIDRLAAYRYENGELLWEVDLGRPAGTTPVVAEGLIVMPLRVDMDGRAELVVFDGEQGE